MPTLLALLAGAALAADPSAVPSIPFQQFTLPNGLHVILSEDHTAPLVGVEVAYDVGSKDEKPGRTGFAHLYEHLMFQGTENLPKGEADRLIEASGGASNGSTSTDRTQYWEQVPSNALEQMLFIQAERMGRLLPTLDQAKLDNQREVVRNERRESYEMKPYGLAWKALLENLWPSRTTGRPSARTRTCKPPRSRTSASSSGAGTVRATPRWPSWATSTR
jgi:zinc protease